MQVKYTSPMDGIDIYLEPGGSVVQLPDKLASGSQRFHIGNCKMRDWYHFAPPFGSEYFHLILQPP